MDYAIAVLAALALVVIAPLYVSWRLARTAWRAARGARPSRRELCILAALVCLCTFVVDAVPGHPPVIIPKPLILALFTSSSATALSLFASIYVAATALGWLAGVATGEHRGISTARRWLPPVVIVGAYVALQLAAVAPLYWQQQAKYSAKSGRVVDVDGRPVAGAIVLVTGLDIDARRFGLPWLVRGNRATIGRPFTAATTTGLDGSFSLPAIEDATRIEWTDLFWFDFERSPKPGWLVSVLAPDLRLQASDRQPPAVSFQSGSDALRIADLVMTFVAPTDRGFLAAGVLRTDQQARYRLFPSLAWAESGQWSPASGQRIDSRLQRAACEAPPQVVVHRARDRIAELARGASANTDLETPHLIAGDLCRALTMEPRVLTPAPGASTPSVDARGLPQPSIREHTNGPLQLVIRETRIVAAPVASNQAPHSETSPPAQRRREPAPAQASSSDDRSSNAGDRDRRGRGMAMEGMGSRVESDARPDVGRNWVVEERFTPFVQKRPTPQVDAIRLAQAPEASVAMIGDRSLRVGDRLPDGGQIDSIRADRVSVVYEYEIITVRVGVK